MKKIIILFLVSLVLSDYGIAENVRKRLMDDGFVEIPFTASANKEEIKNKFIQSAGTIKVDEVEFRKKFDAALAPFEEQLKNADQNFFRDRVQEYYNKAKKELLTHIASYNELVEQQSNEAADNVISAINSASPKLEASSNYTYWEDQRNNGDPGWGSVTLGTSGGNNLKGEAIIRLSFPITVELSAVVAGLSVNIDITSMASLSGAITFKAEHPAGPTPVNQPTAIVGGRPKVIVGIACAAGGGAVVSIETSIASDYEKGLPIVTGSITAVPLNN